MENLKISGNLFANIRYFVDGNLDEEVEKLLKNGGAQSKRFLSDVVTHLVCAPNYTEEELAMNLDLYNVIPVTDQWIVHSAKLGRLASTKAFDPSTQRLFKSLKFAVTNLSSEDFKCLYAILTFHGAQVTTAADASTTHLICGSIGGNYYNRATKASVNIVSPDWVFDCLKQCKILSCDGYHPRLLKIVDQPKSVPKLTNISTSYNHVSATKPITQMPISVPVASTTTTNTSDCNMVDSVEQTLSTILGFDDDDMGGIVSSIDNTIGASVDDADAAESIANIKSQLQASLPPLPAIPPTLPSTSTNTGEDLNKTPSTQLQENTSCNENNQLPEVLLNTNPVVSQIQTEVQSQPQQHTQLQSQLHPQQQIVFVRPRNIQQQQQQHQLQ
uniref:PAX-interacting protein 1 n=1 Tax=Bactrocera dorsalis TaxID=27457 RepID=A0A034W3Z1_BACDO